MKSEWTTVALPTRHAPPLCFVLLVLSGILTAATGKLPNPRIIEHPKDSYVARNEPSTLNCKATGDPPPTITWYRNNRRVITSKEDATSHRMLLNGAQLFFLRIIHTRNNKPDVGVYHCRATNIHGIAESNNATLTIAVLRDEFRQAPSDTAIAVGERAILKCSPPRGEPTPRVFWQKDSEALVPNERVTIERSGNLVVTDAQKSDTGVYVCVAKNKAGERMSDPAHLKVSERPVFDVTPSDVLVTEGNDAVFRCKASGDPVPRIFWRKEDGQVPKGRTRLLEDRSLYIEKSQVADEGLYVCQAENAIGTIEAVARLTVHATPEFVIRPTSKTVGVGRTVNLQCQVSGNPLPTVYWTKGTAQSLMFPDQKYGRMHVAEDGTFTIRNVRKEDAGDYTCRARSAAGETSTKVTIYVKDSPTHPILDHDLRPPPIIHIGPQNQTLAIKTIAMLPCQTASKPKAIVRWYHNNRVILTSNPLRVTVLDSGTLQISDLHLSDSGRYTCKVMSETGETTWDAYLAVEDLKDGMVYHRNPEPKSLPGPPSKPLITDITDHSVRLSWRRGARQGSSPLVGFQIEYFSPESSKGWQRTVLDKPKEQYVVYNLKSSTSYLFFVRGINSHGIGLPSSLSDIVRTRSTRRGSPQGNKPGKPRSRVPIPVLEKKLKTGTVVELTKPTIHNSTQVLVRWRVIKAHDVIQGFRIRCTYIVDPIKPEYGRSIVANVDDPEATSYTIRNLRKFAWYDIRIQAYAGVVKSGFSESLRIQTPEDYPSAPPQNVVVHKKDGTVTIRWNRPKREHWNGIILGYFVFLLGNESKFDRNLTRNSTTFEVKIHGIHRDINYNVQVAAYNSIGMGTLSKPVSVERDSTSVMHKPWFIGLLIGTIGGTLWLALCFFTLWMCKRRRSRNKLNKQAMYNVPFHVKSEDVVRQESLIANGKEQYPGIMNGQPDLTNLLQQNQQMYSQSPDTIYHSTCGQPQTHMTTFYNQSQNSVNPYASTTLINGTLVTNHVGLDHSFKPIHQGYIPHGSGSSDSCIRRDFGSSGSDNSRPNTELITEAHDGIYSPGDSSGYTTDENGMPVRRHRKHAPQQPPHAKGHVNWAELLPPPPEHPPPSEVGSDSPTRQLSPALQSVLIDPCKHLNNPPHHGMAPDWAHVPSPSRNISYSDSERANSPYKNQADSANRDYLNRLVHDRTLPRRFVIDPFTQTVELPRNFPFIYAQNTPEYSQQPQQRAYPQRVMQPRMGTYDCENFGRGDPGVNTAFVTGYPSTQAADAHFSHVDQACQSTLPRDTHDNYMPNHQIEGRVCHGDDVPDYAGDSDIDPPDRQECTTPESSVGGENADASSVTASMLASWASVADTTTSNTSCSSVRSSVASTSDGMLDAEADFATAVAKAAELSGMTVTGSTVTDPHHGKREQRRHRSSNRAPSPYSTDSNMSSVAQRPYPGKSHRKKPAHNQGKKPVTNRHMTNGSIAEIQPLMANKSINQDPNCVDEI